MEDECDELINCISNLGLKLLGRFSISPSETQTTKDSDPWSYPGRIDPAARKEEGGPGIEPRVFGSRVFPSSKGSS